MRAVETLRSEEGDVSLVIYTQAIVRVQLLAV